MNKKFQIKEQYKLINFLFCTSKLVKKKTTTLLFKLFLFSQFNFVFLKLKKLIY